MNLLIHREYSFRASTFISIYTDRIEFISIGGLVSGVTLKDVTMGISVCRNVKLAKERTPIIASQNKAWSDIYTLFCFHSLLIFVVPVNAGDATEFVEFMLGMIRNALKEISETHNRMNVATNVAINVVINIVINSVKRIENYPELLNHLYLDSG